MYQSAHVESKLINYLFSLKNSRPCRNLNQDLHGTKPICYQLSYPGLDSYSKFTPMIRSRVSPEAATYLVEVLVVGLNVLLVEDHNQGKA